METLDVTKIEPRLKHPTIFERFDALERGQVFVIHNDHDPKPLYYQLIAERGQTFEWEYLKEGPEVWEVRISKLKNGEESTTIGELAAKDYRKVEVFRKFGLDFCCGGDKSLDEACKEKGIDAEEVEKELSAVDSSSKDAQHDFDSWNLGSLSDYITNTHHKYVNDSLPMLYEFSDKVASVHGGHHPEVVEIARLFNDVAEELRMHMNKEESILFPYIKELATAKKEGQTVEPPPFGSVENPIRMMEAEHDSCGNNMKRMREISNSFTTPEGACASYRTLYGKLDEFERDLTQHLHLENNILFPKSIKLEKELLS